MNQELISQFTFLYNYNKSKKDKGRTIAYSKAILALKMIRERITDIDQLKGIRNIGPKIRAKIDEFLNTGKIEEVEDAKKVLSSMTKKDRILQELQSIHGIGAKVAEKLYLEGVRSIKDLRSKKELLNKTQLIGLKYHKELQERIPRNDITALYVILVLYLKRAYGNNFLFEIAGSYRRGKMDSGDIDCLISPRYNDVFTLEDVVDMLKGIGVITDTLSMKKQKFIGIAHCPGHSSSKGGRHYRLDIQFINRNEWGSALLYFTGSKEFNVYMRAEAKRQGYLLNEHGLFNSKGKKVIKGEKEKDIFDKLNIEYILPKDRE